MALNSFAFLLVFLPIVVIGANVIRDHKSARAAQAWILAASLGFYCCDRPAYLPLLLFSIGLNWAVARAMVAPGLEPPARKRWLVIGLSADIVFLCVFKYANVVAAGLGRVVGLASPNLSFPLGVSFFTLTQVMYLVDCYERLVPANSLFDHATFVSLFPNVTAGPLVRAKSIIGQLGTIGSSEGRDERIARGVALLVIGLFKKVVLADAFARIADTGYANVGSLSTIETWLTALAFTFQMYFDFSGYSDMAFGAARLLGIELVRNFNAPYRAITISDFWQRWHISLSKFITTYLYTPLVRGMGRVTVHTSALATLIAMSIAGVWHGAAWTYLLFYTLHGVALAAYQYWKRGKRKLPKPIAAVVTFAFVNLAFVVFRAPDVPTALSVARQLIPDHQLFGFQTFSHVIAGSEVPMILLPAAIGVIAAFVGPTSDELAATYQPSRRAAAGMATLVFASLIFMIAGSSSGFIYRAF